MTLEQGEDPVSAIWDDSIGTFNVRNKKTYRWVTNDKKPKPMSENFYELNDALNWIIEYDKKHGSI
jgi:hypothetical protein